MKRIEHKIEGGVELKWCGRCKRWLPLIDSLITEQNGMVYRKDVTNVGTLIGLQLELKPEEIYPLKKREWSRKATIRSYGITPEEFESMKLAQGNKCAICGSADWGRPSPSIDHDHETGKVRGLLCNRCNRTLGLAEDSIPLLIKMAKYLRKNGRRQTEC